MRVEDLDASRLRPGMTEQLLADLSWLQTQWDEGPIHGPHAPYFQSQRHALYEHARAQFERDGLIYPCKCSRKDVADSSRAPHGQDPVYLGTCRGRDPAQVMAEARAAKRGFVWRFAVQPGEIEVLDLLQGRFGQDVARDVGDFVVFRSDGVASYQLAVVVDDIVMEIDHVLRGRDLLASTPRQVLLYRALGATPPNYAHVGLVLGDGGERLAKRDGAISLRELRLQGISGRKLHEALTETLTSAQGELTSRDLSLGQLIADHPWLRAPIAAIEDLRSSGRLGTD